MKLSPAKPRDVIRVLERVGFERVRQASNMKYAVILEQGENSFGAYISDLPGCVAIGETKTETLRLIREAIELHLEALRDEGGRLPEPSSSVEYVEVAFA